MGDLPTEIGKWNWNLIHECFWSIDRNEFHELPTHALARGDKIILHYNSSGIYSAKSGYHLAMGDGVESSDGLKGGTQSISEYFGSYIYRAR